MKNEEWIIAFFTEKRRIKTIVFPDQTEITDNSNRHLFIHKEEDGSVWVVEMNERGEQARYNIRYIETIIWYNF